MATPTFERTSHPTLELSAIALAIVALLFFTACRSDSPATTTQPEGALGTPSPATGEPATTPTLPEPVDPLTKYEPVQGEPITWIDHHRWNHVPGYFTRYSDTDPQDEIFWDIQDTYTIERQAVPTLFQYIYHPANPNFGPTPGSRAAQEYADRALYETLQEIYPIILVPTALGTALFYNFSLALIVDLQSDGLLHHFRFCPPIQQRQVPNEGCHVIHIVQMEELSVAPYLFRVTAMFTPQQPEIQDHYYAQVYASAVYAHDPYNSESIPAQIGPTIFDYVENFTPRDAATLPNRFVGIDP